MGVNGWVDSQTAWFCLWVNDVEVHREGTNPEAPSDLACRGALVSSLGAGDL